MPSNMHNIKLYIFFFLLTSVTALGQEDRVFASLDSLQIRVGSQANLTLKTTVGKDAKVVFPQDKMFGQLEVLESYPVDTIKFGDKNQLIKKYGITQFDSGRYAIPPLSVIINNRSYKTEPFYLEVANVKVDTTKQKMYDIKPVASQGSENYFWWYLLVFSIIIITAVVIYYLYNQSKKEKEKPAIHVSPIERAKGSLKRLDHKQLLQKGEVKEYYSELSRIVRTYIEEIIEMPAMESTTGEVLQNITTAAARKRMQPDEAIYPQLERVLKNADMAKFALSRPDDDIILADRASAETIVNAFEESVPEPTQEEIELTEAYKLQQLQRKQRKKRKLIIAACGVLVIGTVAAFAAQRFYHYLQETVIGYNTEDLWDNEWVKSEYGNPAITINTPKVLKRMNVAQALPKEVLANFQEIQSFEFGPPFGSLQINVTTIKFIPGVQSDIQQAIEQSVGYWEQQGAKNITVNTEIFKLEDDMQGVRAFGTLSHSKLGGESKRYYYEIIYFQQFQGMQQIMILREDQDEFGIKIAEKIKKSIEFKKVR